MPLISCPDCGASISAAAPACIHCGRPMHAPPSPEAAETPPDDDHRSDAEALACPRCGSEQVRRLSLVHADGFSRGTTFGSGTDSHGHHVSTSGFTRLQTKASSDAAPPEKRWALAMGTVGCFTVPFVALVGAAAFGFPGFLLAAGGTAWYFVRKVNEKRRWNAEVHPGLMEQWRRTFRCDRCGARFQAEV